MRVQNILDTWNGLDGRRRLTVLVATLAMFAAVLALSRIATAPGMTLLYAGLEPSAAGEVVTSLDQRGVAYEIRGGGIYVDSSRRDELRMTLASEGLPATGGQGYEILDGLSGFGTTSQMFDAAYWRAKEGELARTLLASPRVRAARVHISNPASHGFGRNDSASASVSVTATNGRVTPAEAKAFKFLIASAVSGLSADGVSVIDGTSGAVVASDDSMGNPAGDERAEGLRRNVQRLLEAHVGPGNAVVEVSIETETDREQIIERRFDPDGRVAVSSETEERSNSASGTNPSAVTVASNLPDGEAGGGGGESQSQETETRERTNFEVSETQRELLRTPGAIKRLTVAVLVNGVRGTDGAGAPTWAARDDDQLGALRELVASAVGFNEDRGDQITIKSLELLPVEEIGTAAGGSLLDRLNIMTLIQLAILALVTLGLGLFVLKPALSARDLPAPEGAGASGGTGAGMAALPPGAPVDGGAGESLDDFPMPDALTGEIDDSGIELPDLAVINDFDVAGVPGFDSADSDDPVGRLRQMIEERQDETIEILKSWMEDDEEAKA
ncbi:flagellar basal-body MS-ring/collar protein FliF [Oceanicola sp. 502str15]|uniref:flagellar basal-body MS-ring/collar protein FliF n=1 Tax=Oceanicola sp. 502str15 TaxID=2696061 RepID=UPI00209612ED|nr:flagellar basal-body MS-ring/collar protein FliF [Oceanicola sp. 502str15]MCO6384784.1 flagellar M-ring protein FliF [Oceanicola sp. 502str15]